LLSALFVLGLFFFAGFIEPATWSDPQKESTEWVDLDVGVESSTEILSSIPLETKSATSLLRPVQGFLQTAFKEFQKLQEEELRVAFNLYAGLPFSLQYHLQTKCPLLGKTAQEDPFFSLS
jgi:hypothetical protein